MSFLNPTALYFLPVALLPLLSLLTKRSSERVKLVSWLILLKDSEIARKRKFLKNLIIILRCLILALLIVFLARPIPKRYSFDKIYFETGIFAREVEQRNKEYLKSLVSYYGKRVETFCDPLKPGKELQGKFYVISDFSDPLLYQRFSNKFYYDTLPIKNAGIIRVDFDPVSKSYYLKITNYNLVDSNFRVIVFRDWERIFESNVFLPSGKSITWKQNFPGGASLLRVCIEAQDDIPSDNCVELPAPQNLRYHFASKNVYVERFMKIVGNEASVDSADVIISFNSVVKPGKNARVVIVFYDRPLEQIKSITGTPLRDSGPIKILGLNFGKVFLFDSLRSFENVKSFMESVSKKVELDGVLYVFIGFIPDIAKNEVVYSPDFWSYFLQILRTKPAVAYTPSVEKVGKILNDTLFLQDTLQTKTGHAYDAEFNADHLPLQRVIRQINITRFILLSLLIGLVSLEFYLSYRYLAD